MRLKKPKPLGRAAAKPRSATLPRVTAGNPKFWDLAYAEMPEFFDEAQNLTDLTNRLLQKPIKGQRAILLYVHAAVVADSFGAVVILCLNGYCHDATVIARSMFEHAVNARYLNQATVAEIEDFIDFAWVRKKKFYDYLVKYKPQEAQGIPASTVQGMSAEFAKVEQRFLRSKGKGLRDSWSAKSIRDRAESVQMGDFYPTFYATASGLVHGDISGLGARSAKDALKMEMAPSLAGMGTALTMARYSLIVTLATLNDEAQHGLDDELMKLAKRPLTSRP